MVNPIIEIEVVALVAVIEPVVVDALYCLGVPPIVGVTTAILRRAPDVKGEVAFASVTLAIVGVAGGAEIAAQTVPL
jgi:hypothetical protein